MLKKIPGNVPEDSGEWWRRFQGMSQKIPGNVEEDSGECSRRFWGMFEKIPGNVEEDSGECSRRSRGMFGFRGKIPGIAYVLYSVFCNFYNWMYKGPALNFWNWFWVNWFWVSFKLMVPTLWSVFFKPLNWRLFRVFDTPAPVHSNYTISSSRERNGKAKRRKKNSI